MSKAPERIWAQHDTAAHMDTLREMAVKPVDEVAQAFTPYLRADLAKAAEAAAYERAVNACEAERKALLNFGLSQAALGASFCRKNIRALIDPDAASALDAVRAEVRRECAEILMREALNIRIREQGYYGYGGPDPRAESAGKEQSEKAILLEKLAATIREGRWQ